MISFLVNAQWLETAYNIRTVFEFGFEFLTLFEFEML